MKKYVNDLGHARWQPELPDGRRLFHRHVGGGYWADEWTRPSDATGGYAKELRRFKWSARLAAWRQLRREAKHNWKPVGQRTWVQP